MPRKLNLQEEYSKADRERIRGIVARIRQEAAGNVCGTCLWFNGACSYYEKLMVLTPTAVACQHWESR